MTKITIILVLALTLSFYAEANNFESLKSKLRNRFSRPTDHAVASAAAFSSVNSTGSGANAAAAAVAAAGSDGSGAYANSMAGVAQRPVRPRRQPMARAPDQVHETQAQTVAQPTYVEPPRPQQPRRPATPSIDSYRQRIPIARNIRARYPNFVNSAVATAQAGVVNEFSGPTSNSYVATTGTYANNDQGRESSAYKRVSETVENQEEGRADDNHYYNSQSFGRAEDENLHEAFSKNDEDIEHTPTVFRSKKSGENYVKDFNKSIRETGSGVLAKDKHSSAYNKNSKKFNEKVDQSHSKEGAGIIEQTNDVTSHDFDDEDEEIFDSDGLEGFVGHGAQAGAAASTNGGGATAAAAASATSH